MTGKEAIPTKKMRYGPGPLMVFGLALLAVAAWCGYDLWSQEWYTKNELSKIIFNWGGMIVAAAAAVYAFILAAVRSQKPA